MSSKYIDAHAHIHSSEYDTDREEVIKRMREAGVVTITVGTHLESSKKAVELAEKEEDIFATIGIHPTDTEEIFNEGDFAELAKSKKVVAIGECGLDYYHEKDPTAREKQKENFLRQLDFAAKIDKPLMIHCRPSEGSMDAHDDMLALLSSCKPQLTNYKLRGNIHFFTAGSEVAEKYFALNFTVSIPGVVTFAKSVAEEVAKLPIDKIISETDCPFAAPVPYRGKRNEPAFVVEVVRKIAEVQKRPMGEVEVQIMKNAKAVFGLQII